MSLVKHFRELDVYQSAMTLTMRIFELTKKWPADEGFNLTDQIRRSSRSVCTNLAEAWRKRRYQAAFVAKLSDSETEAAETEVSTEIAARCRYLDEKTFSEIDAAYEKICGQIVKMADQPEKWIIRSKAKNETAPRSISVSKTKPTGVAPTPTPRHPDTPFRSNAAAYRRVDVSGAKPTHASDSPTLRTPETPSQIR